MRAPLALTLGFALLAFLAAAVRADVVRLSTGDVLRGEARETGLTVEVRTTGGVRTVKAADVSVIEWDRPAPWLTRPPGWPNEVDAVADLDVTCIEVLPRPRYGPKGSALPGERGQRLTYVAHVVNRGTAEAKDVDYLFRTDREVLGRGSLRTLAPGQRLTLSAKGAMGSAPSRVTFEVFPAPKERNRELSAENNRLTVAIAARELRVFAPRAVWAAFLAARNMAGSFSFEDYVQVHVRQANLLLPSTSTALRVGRFDVADGPAGPGDGSADPSGSLRFFGAVSVTRSVRAGSTDALAVDWTLVRRMVGQLGLRDPRPWLPPSLAGTPAFQGLYSRKGAAPLSPFHRLALTTLPPGSPSARHDYLGVLPKNVVLRLHLPKGAKAESARLVDPSTPLAPRTVAMGPCAEDNTFAFSTVAGLWAGLARVEKGWLRLAVQGKDGEVWGELSLRQLNLAWLRGQRERAVVDVACKAR